MSLRRYYHSPRVSRLYNFQQVRGSENLLLNSVWFQHNDILVTRANSIMAETSIATRTLAVYHRSLARRTDLYFLSGPNFKVFHVPIPLQ